MKISFDLGIEDNIAFQVFFYENVEPGHKLGFQASQIVTPALLVFLAVIFFLRDSSDWPLYLFFALMAVWLLYSYLNHKSKTYKKLKKMFQDPINKIWLGHKEMELDEEKVMHVSEGSYEVFSWETFVRANETEDYFFIFISSRQAVIIPKNQISQAEVEELRSLFDKHIAVNILK